MPIGIVLESLIAGLVASFACGLGALPALIRGIDLRRHAGLGYAFSGGLMFAASVYNLILPGLTMTQHNVDFATVSLVVPGILLGAASLWLTDRFLHQARFEHIAWERWGGRTGVLIFLAMLVHSFPEGVAVGVGYASQELHGGDLGSYIALAISIHNMPEGLAVALPLRAAGAGGWYCFFAALVTSLPQPVAAVPACLASWFFQPIMPLLMGFAAGAMIFLVLLELIPDALVSHRPAAITWAFIYGFCLMLVIQVLL